MSNKEIILRYLSYRTLLEQLAEESAELCQASLKAIRAAGNGNPTPVTNREAGENLAVEITDVLVVADILGLIPEIISDDHPKIVRWVARIKEQKLKERVSWEWAKEATKQREV